MIQIAGVQSFDEAKLLSDAGATHVGFPLRLPVHKEDTTEEEAREIIRKLPNTLIPVLITYINKAQELSDFAKFLSTPIVQIHCDIEISELQVLKSISPNLKIIKSLVVRGDNTDNLLKEISKLSPHIDYFITDTYDPTTGASGATGKTHDWSISRKFVEVSSKPVILAGGINAENAYEAIQTVKPFGVDTHTGVEDKLGNKDPELVAKFVKESNRAFNLLKK